MTGTKKYTVKDMYIIHNGKLFMPEDMIELTDEEAEMLSVEAAVGEASDGILHA